ncbi:MAG: hypothetical protein ABW026_08860 [Microvirga sp.]
MRRLKAQRVSASISGRSEENLTFVDEVRAGRELMLDTCVYIDVIQGKIPQAVEGLLTTRIVNHSAICLAELTHLFGRLDPNHEETPATLKEIRGIIENDIPSHRMTAPSTRVLGEAGMLAGLTTRLSGRARDHVLLNDAILYLQAQELGCVVLTRNVADFDLFHQLLPTSELLFYRQV